MTHPGSKHSPIVFGPLQIAFRRALYGMTHVAGNSTVSELLRAEQGEQRTGDRPRRVEGWFLPERDAMLSTTTGS